MITVNHQPAPGYLFLENAGQGGFRYAMILDNDGSPLWYRRGDGWGLKVQENGLITWGAFTGVDANFNFLRNYFAANGHTTGNHLPLSSRHISEVTKIHRDTGRIIWRLGGAHSDFAFVADPLNGFPNQHDPGDSRLWEKRAEGRYLNERCF